MKNPIWKYIYDETSQLPYFNSHRKFLALYLSKGHRGKDGLGDAVKVGAVRQ
jgi:hypothetical protein